MLFLQKYLRECQHITMYFYTFDRQWGKIPIQNEFHSSYFFPTRIIADVEITIFLITKIKSATFSNYFIP